MSTPVSKRVVTAAFAAALVAGLGACGEKPQVTRRSRFIRRFAFLLNLLVLIIFFAIKRVYPPGFSLNDAAQTSILSIY